MSRPTSPFARKYYPSDHPYWRNLRGAVHSGHAPIFPQLNTEEIRQRDWPPIHQPRPPERLPDNQHLDELFYSECLQVQKLGGVKTWQVSTLCDETYDNTLHTDMPEGAADARWVKFYASRVKVDVLQWPEFFRKERWFDLRHNALKTIRDPFPTLVNYATMTGNAWWTVDNPVMWEHISVSLEISHRILKQLCLEQHPWLDALLFGKLQRWQAVSPAEFAHHLNVSGGDPNIIFPAPPGQRHSTAQLWDKLKDYNMYTIFALFDELSSGDPPVNAFTVPTPILNGAVHIQPICLHVGFLRALCDQSTPAAERANVQMVFALTILHEVMHSTWATRAESEGYPQPKISSDAEPYIHPQLKNELGCSFERAVFGGMICIRPHIPTLESFRAVGTHTVMDPWPPWHGMGDLPEAMLRKSSAYVQRGGYTFPLPLLYTSAMQSEHFWTRVVPKYGSWAFASPQILRSTYRDRIAPLETRQYSARRMRIEGVPEPMVGRYNRLLQRWHYKNQQWNAYRPWYVDEHRLWAMSPWSWIEARRYIDQFREAHVRRDLQTCLTCIERFLSTEQSYLIEENTRFPNPATWLFLSIASLMMATVPILRKEVVSKGPVKYLEIFPSSQALSLYKPLLGEKFHVHPAIINSSHREVKRSKPNSWSPTLGLNKFLQLFHPRAQRHPLPLVWLSACMDAARSIARRLARSRQDEWLDFEFQVPTYDRKWAIATPTGLSDHNVNMLAFNSAIPPVAAYEQFISPPPSPYGPQTNQLPPSSEGPFKTYKGVKRGSMGNNSDLDFMNESQRYFTLGEVGNHMIGTSVWVVEPDGATGYSIYRISGYCASLGYISAESIREHLVIVGPSGPMIRWDGHEHADIIRGEFGKAIQCIGKLLTGKNSQEIAENTGKDGLPLWITIGIDIFDLTDFPFLNDEERGRLTENPGGTPGLPDSENARAALMKRLRPYRCGFVNGRRGSRRSQLMPYTESMLSWHDNPSMGMYTSIDGIVYDLTGYMDFHPGGSNVLIETLGRESRRFQDQHANDLLYEYQDLQIGRLVPEVPSSQVPHHQIVLHDWIFDFSGLSPGISNDPNCHAIYKTVSQFGGSDATDVIVDGGPGGEALCEMYLNQKELIVGHIAAKKLPDIPFDEITKRNNPTGPDGAWVTIGTVVYDVTAIMVHGKPFYDEDLPREFAGGELSDSKLATWLKNKYPHRKIGQVVPGSAWKEVTMASVIRREAMDELDPVVRLTTEMTKDDIEDEAKLLEDRMEKPNGELSGSERDQLHERGDSEKTEADDVSRGHKSSIYRGFITRKSWAGATREPEANELSVRPSSPPPDYHQAFSIKRAHKFTNVPGTRVRGLGSTGFKRMNNASERKIRHRRKMWTRTRVLGDRETMEDIPDDTRDIS